MSLRLLKDRIAVACGVIDCGERLGQVQGSTRHLVLMPGYRSDGVVYRMTDHALNRLHHNRRPRRSSGGNVTNPNDDIPATMTGVAPGPWPIKVKCWACRSVETGTPDALDVAALPDEHAEGWGPGLASGPAATAEARPPQRRRSG